MAIFYNLFRCFTKDIIIDNITYHKLFCYIYSIKGEYIGTYNKNGWEEIESMSADPDKEFCCCF
jgi:hypothetical protein